MGKKYQINFARLELKYLINENQMEALKKQIAEYVEPDKYPHSLICGLYFDTPDYLLIRRSMEKPVYKEKLRVRSYGIPKPNDKIFIELKKKYKKITYKRRISMPQNIAMDYLCNKNFKKTPNQIEKEINYFCAYYRNLMPSIYITYERSSFYDRENPDFRITFDHNIMWRDYDLSLVNGIYGNKILEDGQYLLELKTPNAIPLWMTRILTENKIFRTSFSKYAFAYKSKINSKKLGVVNCV